MKQSPSGTEVSTSVDYRDVPYIGSRNLIWIVAQIHLLLAGFVLGVPIFAWVCELIGVFTKNIRYDWLAREFTKLLTAAFATTATFGGILLFLLITKKIFRFIRSSHVPIPEGLPVPLQGQPGSLSN